MTRAVVVGHGSVGRRHAADLARRGLDLRVVEVDAAARARAAEALPGVEIAADLGDWRGDLAVIATWGPSHAQLFHDLADRGVRRFVVEKPMAASVADAAAMAERAAAEGLRLVVHHRWRYIDLPGLVADWRDRFDLGPVLNLVVVGGAVCLSTAGVHWLDLARALFAAEPERVVATARGAPINPRAPDLHYYGGTATWIFPDQREAVLVFNNTGSLAPEVTIAFRHAVITARFDLTMVLRRRDPAGIHPGVHRYGIATEVLAEGPMLDPATDTVAAVLDDALADTPPRADAADGLATVQGLVGALTAGAEGRAVDLPLDPASAAARRAWPVS